MNFEKIYTGFGDQQPGIGIVDCLTGQTDTVKLASGNSVYAVDVCLTDKTLVCGTDAGYVRVYSISDTNATKEMHCLYTGSPVVGVAVYPGLKVVALDSTERVISWQLDTDVRFTILSQKQHTQMIVKLPDTQLAGIDDNLIYLWDITKVEPIDQFPMPQKISPTAAVFWSQYNLLVIASRSGVHVLDINEKRLYKLPGYVSGEWRLFTAAGDLYALESQSGMLYQRSGPDAEIRQIMLCRGIADVAMSEDKIVVIDNDGQAFQYVQSDADLRYAGKLPWKNCNVVGKAAEFEQADYLQKSKAVLVSQIRQEFDRAVSKDDYLYAQQLIDQLGELGHDTEPLCLKLAGSCGDITEEIKFLGRMINNCLPEKVDDSMVSRYLELLIQSGQLETALDIYNRFNIPVYQWLSKFSDAVIAGEYVIEPSISLIQLLDIHKQLNIPVIGTFIMSSCKPEIIPEVKISYNEFADKLTEVTTGKSTEKITEEVLELCWIAGNKVSRAGTITFPALEASESYVLIPSLRFSKTNSSTIIEPAVLFSACCKNGNVRQHNDICLKVLKQQEQSRPESFWPDCLCQVISEALMRLKNKKKVKIIKLGGVYE